MLTRIISGAVGAALLAVVLYFHSTVLLPIAVAAMTAVMLSDTYFRRALRGAFTPYLLLYILR